MIGWLACYLFIYFIWGEAIFLPISLDDMNFLPQACNSSNKDNTHFLKEARQGQVNAAPGPQCEQVLIWVSRPLPSVSGAPAEGPSG